jgi:DNA-directed RNA polymerase specialized sigma24 family protein
MGTSDDRGDFEAFVRAVEPRLRRALIGCRGVDGAQEAVAEALAYAWEHWRDVHSMENPAGYLYRVGQSRSRRRMEPRLPAPDSMRIPDVEPALIPALLALPDRQRNAVWLVHACSWTYAEVAEALGISGSAVGTHVGRALESLRRTLEVDSRA